MSQEHESANHQTKEQVKIDSGKKTFIFKCKTCTSAFYDINSFAIHECVIHECNICNYKAISLKQLNRHQKIHIEDKRYFCYFCPSDFINESVLEQHENTHTGEKPYKCGECSSAFPNKQSLGWHMMTHTKKCMKAIVASEEVGKPRGFKTKRCVCDCGLEMSKISLLRHKRKACPIR